MVFGHVGDKWVWVWNPDQLCKGRGFYLFPLRSGRYKLECLRENPKVSFTVVGATQIVPGKFTTGYESTIAFGEMHLDLPEEERRYALRLLVNKYSSAFKEIGEKYIEKSFYRTNILRLDISHISGKCKRLSQ